MTTNHDGGPAFPTSRLERVGFDGNAHHEHVDYPGMSLRDWFAGQALAARVGPGSSPEEVAMDAYQVADAMLAARQERP